MKKFFSNIKNWFARHLPTKRRLIQLYVALLYNANIKGYVKGTISQSATKYACVPGLNCYSCPGAVGACPLGALQNAFAQSGTRAGYYVLGIIGLYGIIFARTVCGFLCPVGLMQELLNLIPSFKIPKGKVTRILSYLKYVVLAVLVIGVPLLYGLQGIAVPGFCKYICPAGTFEGGIGLLINPANWSGSRDLLNMLGSIFTWKFALLCAITVLCVFMYRPFCRFLCPLGAIYGFFNKIAFLGVKVDKVKCTDCGLCVKNCQMDVKCVGDHECIHCGKCMKVCPVQAISYKGGDLFNKNNNQVTADEFEEDEVGAPVRQSTVSLQPAYATVGAQGNSAVVMDGAVSTNGDVATRQGDPPPNAGSVKKRKRDKKFWVEVVAWGLALILLVGSFVYFNFFDKSDVTTFDIGDKCPDFTLNRYGPNELNKFVLLDEQFTLSEHLGSVVVVNFWATWCGPCVAELPHFNQVANDYPEVTVVAIHGSSTEDVGSFITRKTDTKDSWRNYNVIFLQDEVEGKTCFTFLALGGVSTWPMTLIVGKDGNISYIKQGSLTHEKLQYEVEKALNA